MELKTPLLQRPMQELFAKVAKIEIPTAPTSAKTKRESETPKTMSSEPFSQWRMSTKKTKKEPTLELKSEEEGVESLYKVESFGEDSKSEEEAKPATPPPKKKMETRASDKKKPTSTFKTPASQKRLVKTPKKGESSQKKPKRR